MRDKHSRQGKILEDFTAQSSSTNNKHACLRKKLSLYGIDNMTSEHVQCDDMTTTRKKYQISAVIWLYIRTRTRDDSLEFIKAMIVNVHAFFDFLCVSYSIRRFPALFCRTYPLANETACQCVLVICISWRQNRQFCTHNVCLGLLSSCHYSTRCNE